MDVDWTDGSQKEWLRGFSRAGGNGEMFSTLIELKHSKDNKITTPQMTTAIISAGKNILSYPKIA